MRIVRQLGIGKTILQQQMIQDILYNKLQELWEYNASLQAHMRQGNICEAARVSDDIARAIICVDNCLKKGGSFTDNEQRSYADLKQVLGQRRDNIYQASMAQYFDEGQRILSLGLEAASRGDIEGAERHGKDAQKQFEKIPSFAKRYCTGIKGCPAGYKEKIAEAASLGTRAQDVLACKKVSNRLDEATGYAISSERRRETNNNNMARARKILAFNSRLLDYNENKGTVPAGEIATLTGKVAYLDALVSVHENNHIIP